MNRLFLPGSGAPSFEGDFQGMALSVVGVHRFTPSSGLMPAPFACNLTC